MDSIYFEDPLGLLIELASYRFEPPAGHTHAEVLLEAHRIRVAAGDYNIAPVHLADAIERLVARSTGSLSEDRSPKDPYGAGAAGRGLSSGALVGEHDLADRPRWGAAASGDHVRAHPFVPDRVAHAVEGGLVVADDHEHELGLAGADHVHGVDALHGRDALGQSRPGGLEDGLVQRPLRARSC